MFEELITFCAPMSLISDSAAMFAASPVTASIAVTSFETMFSAVRFSSTFCVLSVWSLFPQAARARAPAIRIKRRIEDSSSKQKKRLPDVPAAS